MNDDNLEDPQNQSISLLSPLDDNKESGEGSDDHQNKCKISKNQQYTPLSTYHAARAGDREELELAHKSGGVWDWRVPVMAVSSDSLACLQYAFETKCPWNGETTLEAARMG